MKERMKEKMKHILILGCMLLLSKFHTVSAQCGAGETVQWTEGSTEIIKQEGFVQVVDTLEECLKSCEDGVVMAGCRSVEYAASTELCSYSQLTKSDVSPDELITSQSFLYYEWQCVTATTTQSTTVTSTTTLTTPTEVPSTSTSTSEATTTTQIVTTTSTVTPASTPSTTAEVPSTSLSTSTVPTAAHTVTSTPAHREEMFAHIQLCFTDVSYELLIGESEDEWADVTITQIAQETGIEETRVDNVDFSGDLCLDFDILPSDEDTDDSPSVLEVVDLLRSSVQDGEFDIQGPNDTVTLTADSQHFVWCNVTDLVNGRCVFETDDVKKSAVEDDSLFDIEPVYAALIGTGILVLLLFVIIIVLICMIRQQNSEKRYSGDGEDHYSQPNLDGITENKQEINGNVYSENPVSMKDPDRYKLNIDVP